MKLETYEYMGELLQKKKDLNDALRKCQNAGKSPKEMAATLFIVMNEVCSVAPNLVEGFFKDFVLALKDRVTQIELEMESL